MTRPKRTLDELPGAAASGGYVYALLYSTGVVQVGRTTDARAELTARRANARSLGVDLADWWVSVPHAEWVRNEQRLTETCRVIGARTGPGCYAGVDFALLTGKAHDLPLNETYASGRRMRRRPSGDAPDKRMAVAVRYRAQDKSLRWIASRQSVSQTTIARDLARWERVRDSMPLEIIRLSRPAVTPPRNTGQADDASASGNGAMQKTAVTGPCDTTPAVIPFRRLA